MDSVHFSGLNDRQVAESREKNGSNRLAPPPGISPFKLLLNKFIDPVIVILLIAVLLSLLTGEAVESIGILLAVILSVGISFFSEYRAGKAFDILNQEADAQTVKCIREGGYKLVPREELVVGDVVLLDAGEEIPADGKVLSAVNLYVDQSKFTGEPEPVAKFPEGDPAGSDGAYPYWMLLRGGTVLEGGGVMCVSAVGNRTEIGRTAQAAAEDPGTQTPLQKQLARLGKVIAGIGITLSCTLFLILLSKAFDQGTLTPALNTWANAESLRALLGIFMVAVTLIVVTVPEGLPMSVTLSLACSMRRMAAQNCLVRKLHASETIGAATVICTDKTGTLTQNRMTVLRIEFPGVAPEWVDEAFCVNSTAHLDESGNAMGNPTEAALLSFLRAKGADYHALRDQFRIEKQWSFHSMLKFMATRGVSAVRGHETVLHVKGAPEIVLARCDGEDPGKQEAILAAIRSEQAKGCRVLGFAVGGASGGDDLEASASHLRWLGFAVIADPVRPEVPPAVRECLAAGIKVKIVTGDTAATAGEIGRQIGLANSGRVIEGVDFDALDEKRTLDCVEDISMIARARPNDKLKLVRALEAKGEVVAVTGDGTNDAPALNYADVGIAMGRSGTAIAREAADIILLDDSFRSIANAVLWGRSLYLNIQRFLVFQLTINAAAAGIALIGPFIGVELPLTVIQMLWVNLIMDTFAALALATEPPVPELMKRPPRSTKEFIITPAMEKRILGGALLLIAAFVAAVFGLRSGGMDTKELTLIFNGFVFLQFWNLVNVRVWGRSTSALTGIGKNPVFLGVLVLIAAGQILITQFGGALFRTVPLSWPEWAGVIAGGSVILWAGELERFLRKK